MLSVSCCHSVDTEINNINSVFMLAMAAVVLETILGILGMRRVNKLVEASAYWRDQCIHIHI